ncbi:hypothetical protein AJ78_07461 [Emergomyces pasteurianus Ep9510]|uniref:Uncharacterized protein n=1 Tax=Emergomyces pasteurianus Ep9510 TaxID=1447872 RepID=A0A1J9P611_9EURO|nr:hypothetical protein AJ78_07461 [Emergomyces pasteurianus Ep9510]
MAFAPEFTAARHDPLWNDFMTNCVGSLIGGPDNDIFPYVIIRHGKTAEGPGLERCRTPVDPNIDNLSDAALYLLAFEGHDVRQMMDICAKLYGNGDGEKANKILCSFSRSMFCLRMCHILDGLYGDNKSDSYGPRIHDLISKLREEGKIDENIVRIRRLVYELSPERLPTL